MPRIAPITNPDAAPGRSKDLLASVKGALHATPNIFTTAAHAPAALEALWSFFGAMGKASISPKLREQIALAVGERNHCEYCVAAHSAIGKGAGLPDAEVTAARRGSSADPKSAAALAFALAIVQRQGHVTDAEFAAIKGAGFSDGEVLEILAATVQNIFTNYLNHVAQTAIDFPAAPPLAR